MAKAKATLHFVESKNEPIEFYELLPTLNDQFRPHILSCGAGYDSLALLIYYCSISDEERGFPLENLILIHAVVGGESRKTKELMEAAIFPLCRKHNIWSIQAHRNGEVEAHGITILSSTRQPYNFHTRGSYSLFPYSIMSASVPQRAKGSRKCTLKFKGWVIDAIAYALFLDSPQERFIGYNAEEKSRAYKDKSYTSSPIYEIGFNAEEIHRLKEKNFGPGKQPYDYEIGFNANESGRIKESKERDQIFRFPLIELGFDRQWCETTVDQFLSQWTHGEITLGKKSYCVNLCPFSECNGKRKAGNNTTNDLRDDWLNEPIYGGEAAFVDMIAQAINPLQPLYANRTVVKVLEETQNTAALGYYSELLEGRHWPELIIPMLREVAQRYPGALAQAEMLEQGNTWAVYSVRRIFAADVKMPYRETQILHQGSHATATAYLHELADKYEMKPELSHLSYRFFSMPRPYQEQLITTGKNAGKVKKVAAPRPFVEEMFVLCPASVYAKKRVSDQKFQLLWATITGKVPTIRGSDHEKQRIDPINRKTRKAKRGRTNRVGSASGLPIS